MRAIVGSGSSVGVSVAGFISSVAISVGNAVPDVPPGDVVHDVHPSSAASVIRKTFMNDLRCLDSPLLDCVVFLTLLPILFTFFLPLYTLKS